MYTGGALQRGNVSYSMSYPEGLNRYDRGVCVCVRVNGVARIGIALSTFTFNLPGILAAVTPEPDPRPISIISMCVYLWKSFSKWASKIPGAFGQPHVAAAKPQSSRTDSETFML